MDELNAYDGRRFTPYQVPKQLLQYASVQDSMYKEGSKWFCGRCHMPVSNKNKLPNGHYYCRECIIFGRNESHSHLYTFPARPFPNTQALKWMGQLTPFQEKISRQLVSESKKKQKRLVHAVTGAGKTEMIYGLITSYLNEGKWVCIASPRIDVCIELYGRLKNDFTCPITLMHGESEVYHKSPLIVATTHQLLKFYRAFDLMVIDEVDSFPFVGNSILSRAVTSALKEEGEILYLTATSTKELDLKVKRGDIEKLKLPRRFHNQPLIVPKFKLILNLEESLQKKRLPIPLLNMIRRQRKTNYPLLIFHPIIDKGEEFFRLLATKLRNEKIAYVSSQSDHRKQIIEQFRKSEISILITTTILERGVTFPGVDVFVLLSHHKLFNASSLIQISGRVGRSLDRPTGQLFFLHQGISIDMLKAKKEIIRMNREAYGQ